MQQDIAETIGLKALGWLLGNDELLPVFLGATGASRDDLHAGAQDAAYLGSVLDFLLNDDAWVMEFCESCDLAFDQPMAARQMLPGGQLMNWT